MTSALAHDATGRLRPGQASSHRLAGVVPRDILHRLGVLSRPPPRE
jgi:hypothetical protein